MSTPKVVAWVATCAMCYVVIPIGMGVLAAHVLHGDNSLSDPNLAHWIVLLVAPLPGLILPWFSKLKVSAKVAVSVASVFVALPIEFIAGVTTACSVYHACL